MGSVEPLDGTVHPGRALSWIEAALESGEDFTSGLRSVGLPEEEVANALTLRDQAAADLQTLRAEMDRYRKPGVRYAVDPVPPSLYLRRRSIWQRFTDWLGETEFVLLESHEAEVRIPLFVLGCPGIGGCAAEFSRQESNSTNLVWNLTVYGTGLGGSRELTASAAATFTAAAGETKLVFVPVLVTTQRVAVVQGGREIGTGMQVDSSTAHAGANPGLLVLSRDETPPRGQLLGRFPLAGDTSAALATYEWAYARKDKFQLDLGVDAFGAKLLLKVGTEIGTQVNLKYSLRGGHDYTLFTAEEVDGLLWSNG